MEISRLDSRNDLERIVRNVEKTFKFDSWSIMLADFGILNRMMSDVSVRRGLYFIDIEGSLVMYLKRFGCFESGVKGPRGRRINQNYNFIKRCIDKFCTYANGLQRGVEFNRMYNLDAIPLAQLVPEDVEKFKSMISYYYDRDEDLNLPSEWIDDVFKGGNIKKSTINTIGVPVGAATFDNIGNNVYRCTAVGTIGFADVGEIFLNGRKVPALTACAVGGIIYNEYDFLNCKTGTRSPDLVTQQNLIVLNTLGALRCMGAPILSDNILVSDERDPNATGFVALTARDTSEITFLWLQFVLQELALLA